jgi:predicted O-methyltransferase YrrM
VTHARGDEQWHAVERYIADHLLPEDAALSAALDASAAAGLPPIQVSPLEGQLLFLLATALRAERVLEIGTLGGYSTICLARGVAPRGRVVTLEVNPAHAAIARDNIARAGVLDTVEIQVGAALDSLPALAARNHGLFDLVFIDADKENTAAYVDWAIQLSRLGALIIVDNVVRDGAVIDTHTRDTAVRGMRTFYERVARDERVRASAIQTVGTKGYDGMAFLVVRQK